LQHAYASVPFYRRLYRSHAYHPDRFRSIDHFNDVPVVTKEALREWELTDRSVDERGALLRNTGGTSGEPLAFYIDREAFAREWAHMHAIWRSAGYQPSDLKLTLRGKNLGSQVLRYNVVHNEYVVNSYAKYDQVIAKLRGLVRSKQIAWIHGYPSLVAELSTVLQQEDSETLARIQQSLKGVLLGSEYPAPPYRKAIEQLLSTNVVSWYGQSEMVVLAAETTPYSYRPFRSYGYAEVLPTDGNSGRLIGTSFWNRASPFIRYDTGDMVDSDIIEESWSFRVAEGRVGEFVKRSDGSTVSLTALIFGRHHSAFEFLEHVQVRQNSPGDISLIVVPRKQPDRDRQAIIEGFDLADSGLSVRFEFRESPVRTPSGKLPLLVNEE